MVIPQGQQSYTREHFLPLSVGIVDYQAEEINAGVQATKLSHHLLTECLFVAGCDTALNHAWFMHTKQWAVSCHKDIGSSAFLVELS